MRKIAPFVLTLSILLTAVIFCNVKKDANAEEPLPLSVYQDELDKINEQLGTDYCFPTEEVLKSEGRTIDDVEAFFQQMTLSEFRDYIYNAAQLDFTDASEPISPAIEHIYPVTSDNSQDVDNESNRSYTSTQKWFYSGQTDRYLYITSTIFYANGHNMYASIDRYGDYMGGYPCYAVTGFSSTISSDKRTVSCDFSCVKYISQNVMYATTYNFYDVPFSANGGDLYPSV